MSNLTQNSKKNNKQEQFTGNKQEYFALQKHTFAASENLNGKYGNMSFLYI